MKKDIYKELKFVIGEQYENYEFDLETVELDSLLASRYDFYKYIKGDIDEVFGLEISEEIYLAFNADILSAVCYKFKGNKYKYFRDKINSYLDNPMIESECNTYIRAEAFIENLEDVLVLIHYKNRDTALCYQDVIFHHFYRDREFPTKLLYSF